MRYVSALLLSLVLIGSACSDGDNNEFQAQLARDDCARECDDLNRFATCVTATKVTECKSACRSSSPASARDFADCVGGYFGDSTCEVNGCLNAVEVQPPNNGSSNNGSDPTALCKTNCDNIAVDCPEDTNATATSDCKANCDVFPADDVTSFNTCVDANRYQCAAGTLIGCYDNLGVLP